MYIIRLFIKGGVKGAKPLYKPLNDGELVNGLCRKDLVMFHPVSSKVNLPQMEENILRLWRDNNVFERSVEARRGASHFVLYEGPPTANGSPGIHHMLSRVFKDIIPRYKAMKGYYTPRMAGWDTHGLPVELEVEKELGFSGKAQIEKFGIDKFNARCRENVFRYKKEWDDLTERIGFWIDLKHPYITMDNRYIETVWWTIKQMWDKGLVYQGYKVTPHCPRCGTSFIFIVVFVSILLFSIMPDLGFAARLAYRVLLIPVIGAISYELLKLSDRYKDSTIMRMLTLPGLAFQRLTTREPDDDMIEVAVEAVKEVNRLIGS